MKSHRDYWTGAAFALILMTALSGAAETARVAGVLGGDRIRLEDGRIVRYIGIGIPDFAIGENSPEELQRLSREFNRSLVDRKLVRLVFDNRRSDREGDLLAYVYKGETFVNAAIIENGFALVETDPINSRYTDYFKQLLRKARREQAGFWSISESSPESVPIPPPVILTPSNDQSKSKIGFSKGKIVFTQPEDSYFYGPGDSRLGKEAKPMLVEDALRAGLKPAPAPKPRKPVLSSAPVSDER